MGLGEISDEDVALAYSGRALEYIERFGSLDGVHSSDRQLVDTWAATLAGPVIDAGCGPGHWTNHLVTQGVAASGMDFVPEFIASARASYPRIPFEIGRIDSLDTASDTVGGVLSWYSLIHYDPDRIQVPLTEFTRVLQPDGGLLIGFFAGQSVATFDHAVVTAWTWPVDELSHQLELAGFEVLEVHTRARTGSRTHGAIVARRR